MGNGKLRKKQADTGSCTDAKILASWHLMIRLDSSELEHIISKLRGLWTSNSALHSRINMLVNPKDESSNMGSKDARSDLRDDSDDATNLPSDKVSRLERIPSDPQNQPVNSYHHSSDSDSPDEGASQDSNARLSSREERLSHEQKPPAMNPSMLIKEIMDKWKDICDKSKMQEDYQTKVSRSAKSWSPVPGKKTPTFVHFVLEMDLVSINIKEFLFKAAVPAQWKQLSEPTPGSNGRTALHDAVEKDEATRNEPEESDRTNFTSFFCQLLRDGITRKSITSDDAARVIAATNDDGENCLHLALKFDLPVAEDLIELANNETFLQQRKRKDVVYDNGNTPLHDALEFPLDFKNGLELSHRYLIHAPLCPTISLCIPMEAYAQQKHEGRPMVPYSLNVSEEGRSASVCRLCEDVEKTSSKLKARQSRIICRLLEKCQDALKIHNNARQSPFLYHVMMRDEFMKKHPDWKKKLAPKKKRDKPSERPGSILENARRAPLEATFANIKASRSATAEYSPGPERINFELPSPQSVFQNSGKDFTARQRGQSISVASNCTLRRLRDTYYKFSEEVEELLWEKAFCIGGYDDAHRCLFRSRDVLHSERPSSELPKERSNLERIFTPPERVTISTPEHYKRFKFESTLALVHLKTTPNSADDKPQTLEEQAERRNLVSMGVVAVFEWLKKRDVKRIIKLVVEDNQSYYCNEMTIGKCLEQIEEIRYLNWKRPDLSVQTISKAVNVVELSLYSSGVCAVLSSWSDADGLRSLPKLRKVFLDARKGTEDLEQNRANVENFQKKLADWYRHESKEKLDVIPDIEEQEFKKETSRQTITGQMSTKSQEWKETIIKFTGSLQKLVGDNTNEDEDETSRQKSDYVKVALLDDGMMPGWEGLGEFLCGLAWPRPSESAEDGGSQTPFYMCGPQQHGTRMAKLITEACPFVKLCVAKINSVTDDKLSHPSFDVEQAIDAIYWAIGAEVEVISMSWSIKLAASDERLGRLGDAIKRAHGAKILMFCAASPKKAETCEDKYWPSSCTETISIGAANEYRTPQGYVGSDAEYLFPSVDVIPGKLDGGSSAATALAAGLASLILFCLKTEMTKDAEEKEEIKRKERDTKRMGGKKADKLSEERDDKGEHSNPTACERISAAGDDPRNVIDKVFYTRTAKPDNKYVDIVDFLALNNGKVATFSTLTKLCSPYLNRVKQGNN